MIDGAWEDYEDVVDELEDRASYGKRIGTTKHYPDIPEDGHMREVRLNQSKNRKRNKRAFVEKERAKKALRKRKA